MELLVVREWSWKWLPEAVETGCVALGRAVGDVLVGFVVSQDE